MAFNIYICGVGGQGIGLLAAVLAQATRRAGQQTLACDTHGLAQRGGVVSSHIRLGADALTPQVPEGSADLVLALERLEAARGAREYLKKGGLVIYYDTAYQPVGVRMGVGSYPSSAEVEKEVAALGGRIARVAGHIADARMQNSALLGRLAVLNAVPGLDSGLIETVLKEMLPPGLAAKNLAVFRAAGELEGQAMDGNS